MHYEKFADGSVKCIEDEIPFELPDGWAWTRLGTIAGIITGRLDANAQVENGDYPFFTCGEEVLQTDTFAFDCDAVLLGGNNAVGDFKMHRFSGKFNAYQRVYVITTYGSLETDYLYNHIQYYLPVLKKMSIGSQTRYLKLGMITELLISLPPMNVQRSLSSKINELLNFCNEIEANKSSLAELVINAKSKILDLAIRGQLVPQDPDDEPASVLLDRIRSEKEALVKAGKLKRDKKESIIFKGDDNSYYLRQGSHEELVDEQLIFELPQNWEWCSLLNLAEIDLGKTLDGAKNTGVNHPYLRSVNVRWNAVDLSDLKEMRFEPDEIERYSIRFNDLLICEGGDVGRSCVWTSNREIQYQNALHRVRFYDKCNPFFFMYYMMYYESRGVLKSLCKGVTIKHLTGNVLSLIPFALPPLEEQNRIVQKLNSIFILLDSMICD